VKTQALLSPAQQSEAVRLVRGGMSQREVARRFGVSQPTIAKYLAAAPAPDAPAATPTTVAAIDPNASAIEIARALLAGATAGLAAAQANSDGALVQRHNRDAGNLAILIARLERDARQDDDVFTVSKSEIDAALEEINEKVRAVEAEPLVCARCGHEIRREKAEAST
jgi:predicted transcriptional regulator